MLKNKKILKSIYFITVFFLLIIYSFSPVTGQENNISSQTLPRNYKDIILNMDETSFNNLKKDINYLVFEPDIDVSLYESDKHYYVAYRKPYINKFIFYFYQEKLVEMIIYYNSEKNSIYATYERLKEKYGECTLMDRDRFVWEDDLTKYQLERTNILKVIDKEFMNSYDENQKIIDQLIDESEESIFDNF